MPTMSPGSSKHRVSVMTGGIVHDRLVTISARLGLPVSEVALRLMMIGMDTSQDLALSRPATEGVARYDRSTMGNAGRGSGRVPDRDNSAAVS